MNPAIEVTARCAGFTGAISEPVVFRVTDPPAPGEVATLSFVAGSFTLADLGTEATDESAPEVAATPVGVTSDAKVTLALAGAWPKTLHHPSSPGSALRGAGR